MVFAPPSKEPEQPEPDGENPLGRLPSWTGTPLEPKNLGAWLGPGTLLCQVGGPEQMEAVLLVDQADVKLVREGQPVKILLDAYPDQPIRYRQTESGPVGLEIAEVSRSKTTQTRWGLSPPEGSLPDSTEWAGSQRRSRPTYQARVLLDNAEGLLRPGLTGQARIRTENLTLAQCLWRLVCQTFRLE